VGFADGLRIAAHFEATRCRFSRSVEWRLQRHGVEPFPASDQKSSRLQAVEHAMVEREAEVHHRLDADLERLPAEQEAASSILARRTTRQLRDTFLTGDHAPLKYL
jgi:hypothetical protein